MIGPLGLFFTAIRQHGCTPSLPAGVMIFPEDVPKQDEALPRALSDRVMAQLEHPDNLARWNNLGGHRRARHPPRPGQRRCQPARLTAVRTPMRQIPDMIGPLPDQPCVHPDRGYDSTPTRDLLDELGYIHEIARKPIPAPIQAGKRWVVERTHSWMNGYGKIRRCTEKRRSTVEFYLHLAATLTVIRRLINEARTRYRWPARPTTRRLK